MAKIIGNGLSAVFGGGLTIAVTSISLDGGERPQIDITAASDTQRSAVPGRRGVPSGSLTGILQDGQIDDLEAELTVCDVIALAIQTNQADCSTAETLLNANVHVTGFTIDASMDEAVSVTVNFILQAGDTMIPPAP